MRYNWRAYTADDAADVDGWMDDDARYYTGCDDGWDDYVRAMLDEDYIRPEENFFCRIIVDQTIPIAALALFLTEDGVLWISEFVVRPEMRGRGHGSAILAELVTSADAILGCTYKRAEAVIYPNNIASIRAFAAAGFHYTHTHPDGDAYYYRYGRSDTDE